MHAVVAARVAAAARGTRTDEAAGLRFISPPTHRVQLAIWIWTGLSCKFLEERRKDYLEMMAHHVLTVALILNSFVANEMAIGLVVLTCHDVSDIVLDLMKMANYLKVEDSHGFFVTEVFFVLNTYVAWYVYTVKALARQRWRDGGGATAVVRQWWPELGTRGTRHTAITCPFARFERI